MSTHSFMLAATIMSLLVFITSSKLMQQQQLLAAQTNNSGIYNRTPTKRPLPEGDFVQCNQVNTDAVCMSANPIRNLVGRSQGHWHWQALYEKLPP